MFSELPEAARVKIIHTWSWSYAARRRMRGLSAHHVVRRRSAIGRKELIGSVRFGDRSVSGLGGAHRSLRLGDCSHPSTLEPFYEDPGMRIIKPAPCENFHIAQICTHIHTYFYRKH